MKLFTSTFFKHFLTLSIFLVSCHAKKLTPLYYSNKSIKLLNTPQDTIATGSLLFSYKQILDAEMNEIIGFTNEALKKDKPNGTLGNLVSDAIFFQANKNSLCDAALVNYGGIRIPFLGKGYINLAKVFEIMPFDNNISLVKLPGNYLDTLCNHIAKSGGWPISNLSFTIKNDKAIDIKINGQNINYGVKYIIAMSDYIANGGDNLAFLKLFEKIDSKILVRAALQNFIKEKYLTKESLIILPTERILKAN